YSPPAATGEVTATVTSITSDADGRTVLHVAAGGLPTLPGGLPGALTGALIRIVGQLGGTNYRTVATNTADSITVTEAWPAVAVGNAVLVVGLVGLEIDRVPVLIHDGDTPGVVVVQSGGTTRLVEGATGNQAGATDTVTVRLTTDPGQTIQIRLSP